MTEFKRRPSASQKKEEGGVYLPTATRIFGPPVHPSTLQRALRVPTPPAAQSAFLVRPAALQRAAAAPVLEASRLQTAAVLQRQQERLALQGQVAELREQLPPGASEQAAQQVPGLPSAFAPSGTAQGTTPQDWAGRFTYEVSALPRDSRGTYPADQAAALQRRTAEGLLTSARISPLPPVQRYGEVGQALATLQRQPLGGAVARVALARLPRGEQLFVQRAMDEALQRLAEEDARAAKVEQLQTLQRQLDELNQEDVQASVMRRVRAQQGGGHTLPVAVQRQLEAGLNIPRRHLQHVRVHTGHEAHGITKSVNAIAATVGNDIFFQRGRFDPTTPEGLELMGHEVTHTYQQASGRVQGGGIDPDAGLEQEARQAGKQLLSLGANRAQLLTPQAAGHAPLTGGRGHLFPVQRRAALASDPGPEQLVQKLGVIKHTGGANLHAAPQAGSRVLTPAPLPAGTKVFVLSWTGDGWSKVSTPWGQAGYVQTQRVTTDLPDPGARLIKVPSGMTAIGVAERYFGGLVKPGQDLRFYVNALEYVNRQRGTGAFQGGQELKAGELLWVPGAQMAQSLVGRVGSGSITGGAWAQAKDALGSGPAASILRSVMESPQYVGEVLGEAWSAVKQHWPVILGTTVALVGAELLVGVLAAAPEPTTITKFLAVGLQGLITAIAGVGAVVSAGAALKEGETWLRGAWTAHGNAARLKAASKAFLRMVGDIVMAVASAAGVKAGAGKTATVARIYTREQLIAQVGSKTTYESLMGTLQRQGVGQNRAQLLGQFLKRMPDPLELRAFLRKVEKPQDLLGIVQKYPLPQVRKAMSEIDAQSIPPEHLPELLRLKLEYPVPSRALTPKRQAQLRDAFPGNSSDKTYQGKSNMFLHELTPEQLQKDAAYGERLQALLQKLLDESEYVYRYTTQERLGKLLNNKWDIRDAYMSNVLVKDGNASAFGAQLKPGWYDMSGGVPDVVLRIPRRWVENAQVPRPTGNTAEFAGWEFTTSAYPQAGRGGLLQFTGTVKNEVLAEGLKNGEIARIPLSSTGSRLPTPKKEVVQ